MTIDKLHADLASLREAIAAADGGDPQALARLDALASAVEDDLAQEAALGDRSAWIGELEEQLGGFEATHPNLAAVVNSLLNTLASIGI